MSSRRSTTRFADSRAREVFLLATVCLIMPCWPTLGQEAGAPPTSQPAESQPALMNQVLLEEDDVDLLDLEIPIVVSAARYEQKITDVPYAVSVITAEDIRRIGARNIPDALRLAPGVDVADLTSAHAAVSSRGFHGFLANKLLVLVDGRQIFDSFFGGTLWNNWAFQMENIERIEVIRGPGGVTWGANAVNGVINIITKDPADQAGFTSRMHGGSRGIHGSYLGYAWSDEKLRLRVSSDHFFSDGFRSGGSRFWRLDDELQRGNFAAHAIFEASQADTLMFSAGSLVGSNGAPITPLAGFGTRDPEGYSSFLMTKWTHRVEADNTFEVIGYVNDAFGSPGLAAIDYRYDQLAFQFGHTFKPADRHRLSWGFDSRVDLLDGSNSDPFALRKDYVNTAIIGMYLQDEWKFAPRWTLNLGGRVDYEFYGGFQPGARAALSYHLSDDSLVYGAVSRAFQMAPAAQRYADIPLLNGLIRLRGIQDIEPETLIAYELGYRGSFLDRLTVGVNGFWHEYDDLRTFTPGLGPPGMIRIDYDNRAAASLYGIELDARYAATKKLTLLGNYTFERLNWRAGVPFHQTDCMSPPEHKFMVGVQYALTEDWHLSGNLYYVDDVNAPNPHNPFTPARIDSYLRLDLRVEHEFWDDRAALSLGVTNLLDPDHYEGGTILMNNAEVPRMIYAQLRVSVK